MRCSARRAGDSVPGSAAIGNILLILPIFLINGRAERSSCLRHASPDPHLTHLIPDRRNTGNHGRDCRRIQLSSVHSLHYSFDLARAPWRSRSGFVGRSRQLHGPARKPGCSNPAPFRAPAELVAILRGHGHAWHSHWRLFHLHPGAQRRKGNADAEAFNQPSREDLSRVQQTRILEPFHSRTVAASGAVLSISPGCWSPAVSSAEIPGHSRYGARHSLFRAGVFGVFVWQRNSRLPAAALRADPMDDRGGRHPRRLSCRGLSKPPAARKRAGGLRIFLCVTTYRLLLIFGAVLD